MPLENVQAQPIALLIAEYVAALFRAREDGVANPKEDYGFDWAAGKPVRWAKFKGQAQKKGELWSPPAALSCLHQEIRIGVPKAALFRPCMKRAITPRSLFDLPHAF